MDNVIGNNDTEHLMYTKWEPFEWYKKMRKDHPIHLHTEYNYWDAFKYDDVSFILSNYKYFSSARYQGQDNDPFGESILFIDPPRHKQMRDLVNKSFTPKAMQSWESKIERISNMLIEDLHGKHSFDLVNEFSMPLPVIIIANILGVPTEELHLFKEWSDNIVEGVSDTSEEAIKAAQEKYASTINDLTSFFAEMINHKRNNFSDDIISILLQAEVDGKKLTQNELIGFCILLLVAGNETTTNLITNAVYCFLDDRTIFEQLKQNEQLLVPAIEEVLRYRSPVQAMERIVKQDIELHGQLLKAGDYVVAHIGSANRDETKFPQADQFLLDRSSNPHLAFGKGVHFCLGAPLARMEARIALTKLIRHFPEMNFADDMSIEPIISPVVYGLKKLKIEVSRPPL
ncbi:cytochrome P450 [Bacillus sp. SCS-151]|uniref:cytochrome P450 n=1 Tax=Nanhaiella sioensis TaxID=3115293 RepID=UPI00397CF484